MGEVFETLNCSSRRESALISPDAQMERTHVRCYAVHCSACLCAFRAERCSALRRNEDDDGDEDELCITHPLLITPLVGEPLLFFLFRAVFR